MRPALRRLEPAGLAVLGAAQSLALVATGAWWLAMAAVAALVWRLHAATPRRAAWLAWCFGTAWLASAVWWLFISMHRYGALPAWLAALGVAALCAALSLYLAAAAALYVRLRGGRPLPDALLFAACWLLAELARGLLFTGFPWGASGYTQVDAPLAALAPWIGVYGIGAVFAFVAALLAACLGPARAAAARAVAVAVVVVLGLQLAPRPDFTRDAGSLSVRLLQPNVAQDEKFAVEHMPQTLRWALQALSGGNAELVVGPETVIPLLPAQLEQFEPGLRQALESRFAGSGQAALVGMPLGDFETGYTNSVVGLSSAAPYRYDKVHLVPFGEFIPAGFRWFTDMMRIPLGDFSRGTPDAPSFPVRGQRVAPNICYEDLFGEELALRFADAARAPTILANVSNIAWFGDTVAVPQHLNITRLRTLELQRPMLRATNTGATAIVDHRGRVQAMLAPFTQGTLEGVVNGREGLTPFARWASRLGLMPYVLLALAVLGLAWRRRAGRDRA